MTSDTCVFLLILPELVQLILINVLLIFAMMFGSPSEGPNLGPMGHDYVDSLNNNAALGYHTKTYAAGVITPVLQTEPVAKLMVLGLLCSAVLYSNNSLPYAHGYGLILDDLGQFMSVFLTLSAAASLSLGYNAFKRFSRYEFILILWLSLIGMLCLIKSYSFLSLYLSIELQSLSFYMLAAMRSRTEASAEAGLKYFILSAFSSAMLLLGMALLYSAIGSQTFSDLALVTAHFASVGNSTYDMTCINVGLGCICVSLLFKLGAAPFHAWIADVYEGSHTCITAWFAITSKIGVITALIRLNSHHGLILLLTSAAGLSLAVGSLSAMRQVKLKRLIAFSAVANAGWFLLGLTSGQWQLTLIHLMVYILLSINLFSIFILPLFRYHPSLEYRTRILKTGPSAKADMVDHGADSGSIKYISDLHQIYKINPSLGFAVSVSMFSLAGIPPLAGFYSKYLIISAVTQTEQYLVLSLALAVAVISAFYYLRVVKTIYFSDAGKETRHNNLWWFTLQELPSNALITSCTTALTLVFFVKPDYFCVWLALI
jgi:NADH-quinone oxidoreductase subunit N